MKNHGGSMADKSEEMNKAIVDMSEALLGIATMEKDVLEKAKANLDKILTEVYEQIKQYRNVAAKEAMVSEQPLTQIDPALIQGLSTIANGLNEKNVEILRLQKMLEGLGLGLSATSTQSASILRQQLDELNKRNRMLRDVYRELAKHPIVTGKITSFKLPDKNVLQVSLNDLRNMLEKVSVQIKSLNQANFDLKQQLKQQNLIDKKPGMDIPQSSTRKPGR